MTSTRTTSRRPAAACGRPGPRRVAPRTRAAASRRSPNRRRAGWGPLGLIVLAVLVGLAWQADPAPGRAAVTAPGRCTVPSGAFTLSHEQAANASTIAGVARARHLPDRAVVIALATAQQESRLRNLRYGDRDSLGLFQQRPSQGWGTAAQVQDPVYATNAFYDVLVKVEGYRSLPITTAAQKVQRSGFPHAYAQHEPEARVLASALAGYSPAALTCRLDADRPPSGVQGLRGLRAALDHEQARATASPVARGPGLRLAPTGTSTATRSRAGWSLAQWAVGQADRLGVARVYVDGRVWRRAAPDVGWREVHGAGIPTSGTGQVVVMLSDDDPA